MRILILCGIELLIVDILLYKFLKGEHFTRKETIAVTIFLNLVCVAVAVLNTLLIRAIGG